MDSLIVNSYAKLNLYLEVLGLRKDKFHNIKTVFERIDLHVKIILSTRRDKEIKVFCSSPELPKRHSKNLVYHSAKLLQGALHIDKGVNIKLIKNIPVAAGLGGGSSNAAAVLVALNKLWDLKLKRNKLLSFAKKIGSDVPFFIYDTAFALGSGRGDRIKPINSLKSVRLWHILIVPDIKVLTGSVYKEWERLKLRLTRPKYDVKMFTSALRKRDISLVKQALFNSLEQATVRLYPGVAALKKKLSQLGLKTILMSGSGSAVFAIVSSRKEAVSLYKQLKKSLEKEHGSWRVFITKTC